MTSAWFVMHWLLRLMSRLLALAVATASISVCLAQEVAFVDLTKIKARVDLRRPRATSPITGRHNGIQRTEPCLDSAHSAGALRASIVSLDRTHYQVGDVSTFEVTIENTGSAPTRIPFSPHLADLQPKDPAQKFSYSELHVVLWIAGGEYWSANTGGGVVLYGAEGHPDTMLSLSPGQWARIVGQGDFALPGDQLNAELIRSHPPDRVYAEASVDHDETLITPTQSATVDREVCVVHTPGQSVPIQLTVP